MNGRPLFTAALRQATRTAQCPRLVVRSNRPQHVSLRRTVPGARCFSAVAARRNQADATPAPSKTAKVPTTDLGNDAEGQNEALEKQMFQAIDRMVKEKPVVLFMKGTPETPQCGFSRASVQILSLQGVDPEKFAAFNVLEDNDLRQTIKKYSDWPTIPQLYVDGEFVGGCDILMSMHQDQSLAKLLAEKKVIVEA